MRVGDIDKADFVFRYGGIWWEGIISIVFLVDSDFFLRFGRVFRIFVNFYFLSFRYCVYFFITIENRLINV